MTKEEITAMIKAVPAEAIHEFLRNALKAGILTEDDISEHYGRPFSWLGLAEIHYDDFRV